MSPTRLATALITLGLSAVLAAGCRSPQPAATPTPEVPASNTATAGLTLLPAVIETATALALAARISPTPAPPASATPVLPSETPSPVPTATPISDLVTAPPGCLAVHVVETGEWLGLIARNYGVAIDAIADANGISDSDLLAIGQELCIPAPGVTVVPPGAARTPTPGPGDGLAILEFAVSPNPVERGNVVRLRWTVREASSVSLWRLAFDNKLNQWYRTEVPAYQGTGSGELTLPVAVDARQPLRFELDASDATGQAVSHQSEPIQLACYPAFYAALPEPGSCRHAPITVPAELQAFEYGYMLWRSDTEEVYVFTQRPDRYIYWTIQVPSGVPVDLGLPPAGLYPPGLHFGEVWGTVDATQLGGTGSLRDVVGWASAPPDRFELTFQAKLDSRYPMFDQVFLSWPDGRVVLLYTGGGLPQPGLIGPAWSFISP